MNWLKEEELPAVGLGSRRGGEAGWRQAKDSTQREEAGPSWWENTQSGCVLGVVGRPRVERVLPRKRISGLERLTEPWSS